jgi:hypothetical protein
MSKIKILIQSPNVIFDEEGQPMSHGNEYIVTNGKKIESYISEGNAVVVQSENLSEQREEQKQKLSPTKNSTKQETASTNIEENSNG